MVEVRIKGDAQVQHDVLRELEWDARVEAVRIGVAVAEGLVTLTATMSSYAQRLLATRDRVGHRPTAEVTP